NQTGTTVVDMNHTAPWNSVCTGGTGTPCTISLTGANAITQSGIYKYDGDLTITGYTHPAGKHVTILVNGKTTLQPSSGATPPNSLPSPAPQCASSVNPPTAQFITVPSGAGNLFILASKGDLAVDAAIGTCATDTSNLQLQGIYSSEGSVIAKGTSGAFCSQGTNGEDYRLNFGGFVIANSLHPFATNGSGKLVIQRSLCSDNTGRAVLKTWE